LTAIDTGFQIAFLSGYVIFIYLLWCSLPGNYVIEYEFLSVLVASFIDHIGYGLRTPKENIYLLDL